MLIDTHAHLNDLRLYQEIKEIASSMLNDNLYAIVNVGYDIESSKLAVDIANSFSGMYAAVGIHPHNAKNLTNSDLNYFSDVSKNEKCVAIGEIGLDYYYGLSERAIQKNVFIQQLELANSLNLPVIIHLRDAYQEMLDILKDVSHFVKNGAVFHCYMGSTEYMFELLKIIDSAYFSFGGAITFKNAKKQDIIKNIPLDRLLLETDCPYMSPEPFRGKTNYPKYVNLVKDKISEWINDEDIDKITTHNAKTLFTKII